MKYDGIMFGNGLTINLLQQLRVHIPVEKQYLLSIDSFLQHWIQGKITKREERILYSSLYGNLTVQQDYFDKVREESEKYYKEYNADIEYTIGLLLFKESPYKDILQCFPVFYNVWYIILKEYLSYLNLDEYIEHFYRTVETVTGEPQYVWTTNFDLFAELLKPKHLHGKFLTKIKNYTDVVYKSISGGKNYYYKYIWGHNGIGKLNNIDAVKRYPDSSDFFDFDFFFEDKIEMDKMLIYGMGFRDSGYITELKEAFPEYEKATIGGIIDEHILMRVAGMQNKGLLKQLDITYYSETERIHLEQVMKATYVKNYRLIRCQEFDFKIE